MTGATLNIGRKSALCSETNLKKARNTKRTEPRCIDKRQLINQSPVQACFFNVGNNTHLINLLTFPKPKHILTRINKPLRIACLPMEANRSGVNCQCVYKRNRENPSESVRLARGCVGVSDFGFLPLWAAYRTEQTWKIRTPPLPGLRNGQQVLPPLPRYICAGGKSTNKQRDRTTMKLFGARLLQSVRN